ncbi:MAG TPA: hypothetical protein VLZ76_03650, partial [Lysobacter sp.]|nr:hypothetical protein [Lysobacter sp.]
MAVVASSAPITADNNTREYRFIFVKLPLWMCPPEASASTPLSQPGFRAFRMRDRLRLSAVIGLDSIGKTRHGAPGFAALHRHAAQDNRMEIGVR